MNVTQITNNKGNLAKTLKADGTKISGANLYDGQYTCLKTTSLKEFNTVLDALKPNQAIALGTPSEAQGNIITSSSMSTSSTVEPSTISRTKEHIFFEDEAYILFDIDTDDGKNLEFKSYEELLDVLYELDPQFKEAEILIRPSSSSYIYKWEKGNKTLIKGAGSYHVYVKAKSVKTHLKTYIDVLTDRAYQLGYGYYKVSSSGSLLKRQVFDSAVFSPERLVFEAGMFCQDPYEQNLPDACYKKGGYIDCSQAPIVNGIAVDEQVALEKGKVSTEASDTQEKFTKKHVDKYMAKGHSEESALKAVNRLLAESTLCSEHVIKLDNGDDVRVSDIFVNPEKYDKATCYDPIEVGKGSNKAIIYANKGLNPLIMSFVHGGTTYKLEANYTTIYTIATNTVSHPFTNDEVVDKIKTLSMRGKLSDDERKKIAHVLKKNSVISSISELDMTIKERQEDSERKGYKDIGSKGQVLPTAENLKVLLEINGMTHTYDVVTKKHLFEHSNIRLNAPNVESAVETTIVDFAYREEIHTDILRHISALANSEYSNPLMDFVRSSQYSNSVLSEKVDYIKMAARCIASDKVSSEYIETLLKTWSVQCIAAWDYDRTTPRVDAKDKYESVLVLQGGQGAEKTKFFSALLPDELSNYIKTGALLNPTDKDSLMQTTSYGIVELGELESTFKKSDIGALKAFLSNGVDEYRAPYAKTASKHKRCTSFCGSVNESGFLRDPTGARRFWVIPVKDIDFVSFDKIDKGLMWAQAYELYLEGEKWWFDGSDTKILEEIEKMHEAHQAYSLADETFIELQHSDGEYVSLSASKIFDKFERKANKNDINELSTILERNGYKRDSRKRFSVPLGAVREVANTTSAVRMEDVLYSLAS